MRIPTWRLVLTGGAIVVLAAVGVGLVAASSNGPSTPAVVAAGAPSADPGSSAAGASGALGDGLAGRLGRALPNRPFAKRLVHATITVTGKDGNLVTFQLDHGTIASIGSGSLVIAEAGGGTVTVSTDANTVVFLGGGAGKGTLADLKVGAQIFVRSRLVGGNALARHVFRVPAAVGG